MKFAKKIIYFGDKRLPQLFGQMVIGYECWIWGFFSHSWSSAGTIWGQTLSSGWRSRCGELGFCEYWFVKMKLCNTNNRLIKWKLLIFIKFILLKWICMVNWLNLVNWDKSLSSSVEPATSSPLWCENVKISTCLTIENLNSWQSLKVTWQKKSDSGHCMNSIHNFCNVWNYEWASSEIVTMVYHHWWCCHRWFLPFCASNLMHALPWISRSTQLAKKSDERHSKLCKTLMDAILSLSLSLSLSVSFSLSLQKIS